MATPSASRSFFVVVVIIVVLEELQAVTISETLSSTEAIPCEWLR